MGIPSFYKHLIQTIGGITSNKRDVPPDIFALDLNCAIYHCSRKVDIPYKHEIRLEWETKLILHVIAYIKSMTKVVAPKQTVYIAVDGVAPMAKIKQQRARRFKSAVLAEKEAQLKAEALGQVYEPIQRWDSNSITPGTDFMRRLTIALKSLQLSVETVVSSSDEAGEGEQKIMQYLRSLTESRDVVIYGLDADLIVLALLESARTGSRVDLFREETEFNGQVKANALGEEQYLYMNCTLLAKSLYSVWAPSGVTLSSFLYSFTGAMNLLGNDFVPHGMVLKINDQGIEYVLEILKREGKLLVNPLTLNYDMSVLQVLVNEIAKEEVQKLQKGIRRKLNTRPGSSGANSTDPVYRAISQWNDQPVEWAAEKCLMEQKRVEGEEKSIWFLRKSWYEEYQKKALWSSSEEKVCDIFCKTLGWTLDYYIGRPVSMSWYYPWFLPPTFQSLAKFLSGGDERLFEAPAPSGRSLKPVEQLAMVLPLSSFSLLPAALQTLPVKYPYAWPTGWSYFSMGRRFLWECEPLIPLIQPGQIQKWIEECLEDED